MDSTDTLTCTQSWGAMASLLDWLSKIPETDSLLEARSKTQNPKSKVMQIQTVQKT